MPVGPTIADLWATTCHRPRSMDEHAPPHHALVRLHVLLVDRPAATAPDVTTGKSAMSLHMTPNHWEVLSTVRDGHIRWRDSEGPFGGFTMVDGTRIVPGHDLVALYELRNAGLIAVNTKTGHVTTTADGAVWIRASRLRKAS